jgi:16S rRNA pseudouridine516 synthase
MAPPRVDKLLANLGYGSRADIKIMLRHGRVTAGGVIATDPSAKYDAATVLVDGEPLDTPGAVFVAIHKPVGYVCSHDDRDGVPVYRLLPGRWTERNPAPTTVGRLDKDSSGLLLVTDVGPAVHLLTSPKNHVDKHYTVTLDRDPGADVDRLTEIFAAATLVVEGSPCRPAVLRSIAGEQVEVVLTEGRHRQVRRMLSALGYEVTDLVRTSMGPYALDALKPGEWRHEDPALIMDRVAAARAVSETPPHQGE